MSSGFAYKFLTVKLSTGAPHVLPGKPQFDPRGELLGIGDYQKIKTNPNGTLSLAKDKNLAIDIIPFDIKGYEAAKQAARTKSSVVRDVTPFSHLPALTPA